MIVVFLDGPLTGLIHEVHADFTVPDKIGMPDEETKYRHWYETSPDGTTAKFVGSEVIQAAMNN
jgi:hypothetical protein